MIEVLLLSGCGIIGSNSSDNAADGAETTESAEQSAEQADGETGEQAGDPASAQSGDQGNGQANDLAEGQAAADETAFLVGAWFAKTAMYDGLEKDPKEVFEGTFSLYFSANGECTMWVGQNHAVVDWLYTGDGVTLTGDNAYQITFPDELRKTLIININGVDVLMEKYEE